MLNGTAIKAVTSERKRYDFGRFSLRNRERLLLADGEPVELGSRAFDLLQMLVESAGELVSKDRMLDRAWPGVIVEENNLQVQVSTVRRALGPERSWIVTIPGHGYQFTAPVAMHDDAPAARHVAGTQEPARLSILVLPFESLSDEAALDWFAIAATASLTTDLARALPWCSIIEHTAAGSKAEPVDLPEVCKARGARFGLRGSVLLVEQRVRINAQLIESESGAHIWAERFDKPRSGILQVQDEIVGRISRSVELQVVAWEAKRAEQAALKDPDKLTATDLVLRGHAAASRPMMTHDSSEATCALYARALQLEPGNPDALAGIAGVRIYQVLNGYLEAGRTACDKTARAAYLAEAADKLAQVLAAAPGHSRALKARVVLLRAQGKFSNALVAARALFESNPSEPMSYREIGLNLLYLGRAEEAVEWFGRANALLPSDPTCWTWLQGMGRALIHLGRDAEAVEALRGAIHSNPAHAYSRALLAAALALAGDRMRAREEMTHFRNAEPWMTMDVLTWRCAVPYEATDPAYKGGNARVSDGFRLAGAE